MKVLRHRRTRQRYVADVWLDETKTDSAGNPDPEFVRRYEWALLPRAAEFSDEQYADALDEYERMQRRMLRQLGRRDRDNLGEDVGVKLVSEGDSW